MKNFIVFLGLFSSSAFASECEKNILMRLNQDPNIKLVKMLESYTCGQSACAVTYENDTYPNANSKILAFLDLNKNMHVNWVPVNGDKVYGYERFDGKKLTYISTSGVGNEKIIIDASIETPRDSIFWPPHKVYYQETFNCLKN